MIDLFKKREICISQILNYRKVKMIKFYIFVVDIPGFYGLFTFREGLLSFLRLIFFKVFTFF